MIHSLFLINQARFVVDRDCICFLFSDIFLEKHWKSVVPKNVCDYFFEAESKLLDEMLDNGFPLSTESNILKELIRPPTLLRSFTTAVTGKQTNISETLPSSQLTNVRWRRSGVKYTNNEAYFDVTEDLHAIIDKSGNVVCAEIAGYIDCLTKLSGMPDLTMTFVNPRLLDDASLHPCVRYLRWERERVISFVPPDGKFRLLSYHINNIGYGRFVFFFLDTLLLFNVLFLSI
ncbi:unnamed protein product [Protopolystoma xenopodis]|uniref:MHD domain-containing protein n=1 Tax=Protopolystoma xenopodis TaxID=117903 RepID=A0A3S5AIZ6_9PLAT|nr:unnamed protein product [Protopolystoma xenopodis]